MRDDNDFTEFATAASHPLLTGNHDQAQDLAQSALVRTYGAWSRIRHDDGLAYARRVLVNLHTDWLRRRPWREQSRPALPDRAAAGDDHGTVEDRLALVAALQTLSRRERATLVLRYYVDLPEAETAQTLGISVGTVKSVSSRALHKLRGHPALHGLRRLSTANTNSTNGAQR